MIYLNNLLFLSILLILIILSIIYLKIYNNYEFFQINTVLNTKKHTIFEGDGDTLTGYHIRHKQKKIWNENMTENSDTISYIMDLSKKYNKPFTIIKADKDIIDIPSNGIRFVSSINKYSDKYTYPIPQFDEYFSDQKFKQNANISTNIPFDKKIKKIMWRGQGVPKCRADFFKKIQTLPKTLPLDIKITKEYKNGKTIFYNENKLSIDEQNKYKYIIAIDGFGWPGNINWVLGSGSVPIIGSNHHVWFFKFLEPWIDYVPFEIVGTLGIKGNRYESGYEFPDLEKNLNIILNDDELSRKIIKNATQKISKILSKQKEYLEIIFRDNIIYDDVISKIKL